MKYSQTIQRLESFVKLEGVKPGLERITALLKLLGNPEKQVPVIHIAGTNGKGSTTMMCTQALLECNYKVGTYLSPHLIKYNERFLVQGKEISDAEFSALFGLVYKKSKQVPGVTEFEVLTAMAFVLFQKKGVEVAVVETGLGGRFDATNVCRSIVSIITPIDYDHEKILGNTLGLIAREKAGIIKPGVPVVSAEQKPEALSVILQTAETLDSELEVVCHPIKQKLELLGEYQRYNAALVIEALRKLMKYNIYIPRRLMLNGIAKTKVRGRTELVSDDPITICDVAHNPHGFENLTKVVDAKFPFCKKIFIIGMLKRKNIMQVLSIIKRSAAHVIAVELKAKDAYSCEEIESLAKALGIKSVSASPNVKTGYLEAKRIAKKIKGCVIIAGSFYLVGEFLKGRKK